jgi:hypothetical protein
MSEKTTFRRLSWVMKNPPVRRRPIDVSIADTAVSVISVLRPVGLER